MQVCDFQVFYIVFLLITPEMFQDFERYQHYKHVLGSYTGFFSKYLFSQVFKKHAPYFARCCPLFCSVLPLICPLFWPVLPFFMPYIFQFQPLTDNWPLWHYDDGVCHNDSVKNAFGTINDFFRFQEKNRKYSGNCKLRPDWDVSSSCGGLQQ